MEGIIKELRINNYVNLDGHIYEIETAAQLASIEKSIFFGDAYCEGIELSEEWFIELGLDAVDYISYKIWRTQGFEIEVHRSVVKDREIGLIRFRWKARSDNTYKKDITKVHQLQNLVFDLSGKHLTLPKGSKLIKELKTEEA